MLYIGHIDPVKVAFYFLREAGRNPIPAGSIGHMVLVGRPKECRAVYIGQADLIS